MVSPVAKTRKGKGMKLIKKLLQSESIMKGVCWLIANYIRVVFKTTKWQKIGYDHIQSFWENKQPVIVCFWHNRLLMTCFAWESTQQKFHMLISSHRDGRLISKTVQYYDIATVSGSTQKGAVQAIKKILSILKQGHAIGITPDGPRGPRFRASEGVITIARLSGVPIIPVTYSISRRRVLPSWDRLIFALPFSKGVLQYGEPFYVERNLDEKSLKEAQKNLEERLNALCLRADEGVGQPPILD